MSRLSTRKNKQSDIFNTLNYKKKDDCSCIFLEVTINGKFIHYSLPNPPFNTKQAVPNAAPPTIQHEADSLRCRYTQHSAHHHPPFNTKQAVPDAATPTALPTCAGSGRCRGVCSWGSVVARFSCLYSLLPQPKTEPLADMVGTRF